MPRRPDVPCANCGKLMWRGSTSLLPGKATCRPCRKYLATSKQRPKPQEETRRCARCQTEFTTKVKNKKYCSKNCSKRASDKVGTCRKCGRKLKDWRSKHCIPCYSRVRHNIEWNGGRELIKYIPKKETKPRKQPETKARFICCVCEWCGEQYVWDLRLGGMIAKTCSNKCHKRREIYRQKSNLKTTAFITPKNRLKIYERDNWTCQLCGQPTSREYDPHDNLSPTLDHIIPQSQQLIPDHSPSNLQTAHMICNAYKSDKPELFDPTTITTLLNR